MHGQQNIKIPEDLNINIVSSTCLNKNEHYVTENDIVF
jgi:hypothetical protein